MSTPQSTAFFSDLDRVAKVRHQMADVLSHITQILSDTEIENAQSSGELGLKQTIEDIEAAGQNLRRGMFRLLVLGDMKRGKRTFLNALRGGPVSKPPRLRWAMPISGLSRCNSIYSL